MSIIKALSSSSQLVKRTSYPLICLSNRTSVTETEKFRQIWHNTDSLDPIYDISKKPVDLERRYDSTRRAAYYFMFGGTMATGVIAARNCIEAVVAYLWKPADILAMSTTEINQADIPEGKCIVILWKDSPVFIWHRTDQQIAWAREDDNADLRHAQKDEERVKDPKWYISMAVCTHLGCIPIYGAGNYHGFFCPCHGSHYDASGRIRKGPAPRNLDVPNYKFTNEGTILIG